MAKFRNQFGAEHRVAIVAQAFKDNELSYATVPAAHQPVRSYKPTEEDQKWIVLAMRLGIPPLRLIDIVHKRVEPSPAEAAKLAEHG